MSRSPSTAATAGEVFAYDSAWAALNQMIREGKPFSGHERNCAFLNLGPASQKFANVSSATGLDFDDDGRGLATCDWDFDGDTDFLVSNRTGPQVRFLRNDSPVSQQPRWVAFALEGTRANRDAVGARVEVHLPGGSVRVKTLAAGHSHLSQSSRWLHFGLGDHQAIDEVVVRWPGTATEKFTGIAPGHRYRLVEATGPHAATVAPPAALQPPARLAATSAPESDAGRVVLLKPAPLPPLIATDLTGRPIDLDSPGKPLLLNLWATWCAPCLRELAEWRDAAPEFHNLGLDVVSVSVDDPEAAPDQDLGRLVGDFVSDLRYPFKVGLPGDGLLGSIDTVQRAFTGRQVDLPVPSSLLITADRKLAVIYRGPVTVGQITTDARLLGAAPGDILAAAIPLPGTWIDHPEPSRAKNVAVAFVQKGELDSAVSFIDHLTGRAGSDPALLDTDDHLDLHRIRAAALFDLDDFAGSLASWDRVLELVPGHRAARLDRARCLIALGRTTDAAAAYESLLEAHPSDTATTVELAVLRSRSGEHAAAVPLFDEAIALGADLGLIDRFEFASSLAATGSPARARESLESVLAERPGWPPAANNLAWILATAPDAEIRDPGEALRLATLAAEASGYSLPSAVGTLAAAFASNGRFDDAVAMAEKAIELAKRQGDVDSHGLDRYAVPLGSYREGRPYRDPSLESSHTGSASE